MQGTRWISRQLMGLVFLGVAVHVQAGQTPGVAGPWNGPWGGGFLNGESYSPLANPYVGAGYPGAAPPPYSVGGQGGGYPMQAPPQMQIQPRALPGGGYLLPPGAGGGMLPGAYANH